MKPENKQILDQYEHFYITLMRSQTISGISWTHKTELLKAMREEFWPGYTFDMNCGYCLAKFVKQVYEKYGKWKAENIELVPDPEQKKVKVKASFPKNKLQ